MSDVVEQARRGLAECFPSEDVREDVRLWMAEADELDERAWGHLRILRIVSGRTTFMHEAVEGRIAHADLRERFDDEVDAWHASTGGGPDLPEWLGMTRREYAWGVELPVAIPVLVARRRGHPT